MMLIDILYPSIKSIHIISVITWMAGLFYLPRLFVYHVSTKDKIGSERFKLMEYRLYQYIMLPSMLIVWLSGLSLAMQAGFFSTFHLWLHIKLSCVLLLSIYQVVCGYYLKQFRVDNNLRSERFFRLFNEIPTVLLIAIVFLVVFKI